MIFQLNANILQLQSGSYRLIRPNNKAFSCVTLENTNDHIMINIGSYKYYFNKNGIFDMMIRGKNRCNHCVEMFYEILELAIEQFNTWTWRKTHL